MSKKRPQMHLNVVELVLFDDDMMYYSKFLHFNEQNTSLFYYYLNYLPRRLAFCCNNLRSRNRFTENRVTSQRRIDFLASRKSSKTC